MRAVSMVRPSAVSRVEHLKPLQVLAQTGPTKGCETPHFSAIQLSDRAPTRRPTAALNG